MAFLKAPKTAADAKEMVEDMTPDAIKNLSNIQKIIHYFKKKEWSSMVGAIMGLWKEYFGSDEEKAELAENKEEAKKDEVKEGTKTELAGLQEDVGTKEEEPKKKEKAKEEVEIASASNVACVGDSIMGGICKKYEASERPAYVGGTGFASSRTLARLRRAKMMLDGKSDEVREKVRPEVKKKLTKKLKKKIKDPAELAEAVEAQLDEQVAKTMSQIERQGRHMKGKQEFRIYTGGNNITYDSPEKIVDDIREMIKVGRELGVKSFVVCTRFPPDPRLQQKWNPDKLATRMERSKELRELILEGGFGANVKKVDLYDKFVAKSDEEGKVGYLKDKYATGKDPVHPWAAYKEAIGYMDAVSAVA